MAFSYTITSQNAPDLFSTPCISQEIMHFYSISFVSSSCLRIFNISPWSSFFSFSLYQFPFALLLCLEQVYIPFEKKTFLFLMLHTVTSSFCHSDLWIRPRISIRGLVRRSVRPSVLCHAFTKFGEKGCLGTSKDSR